MAKTLAGLRASVRGNIGETTASFWSELEITDCLNRAKNDLYSAISTINEDFFEESANLTIASGDSAKVLPDDFFRQKRFRISTSGQEDTEFRSIDQSTPEFISGLKSDQVIVNPYEILFDIYSDVTTGKSYAVFSPIFRQAVTIECKYIAMIPDLVTTTDDAKSYSFLDVYSNYLVEKATFYAFCKGPSGDFATHRKVADDEMLPKILTNCGRRQLQSPEFVRGFMEDNF